MISPGEEKAWEILIRLDPGDVCRNASVAFDEKGGCYILKSFCTDFSVSPEERIIKSLAPLGETIIKRGIELGEEVLNYGDASTKLLPMPRIPVTLILWLKDEEFPSRADLLLDSTCELQLPLDIIWSIAMMSVLVMM